MKAVIVTHGSGGSYVVDNDSSVRFVEGFTSRPVGEVVDLARKLPSLFNKATVVALCLALSLVLASFGWFFDFDNYSVYIDINPSIELVFNNANRVKDIKPLNEDGKMLVENLAIKGTPDSAVLDMIHAAQRQGYIETDDGAGEDAVSVLVTVTPRGGKNPEKYEKRICASLADNTYSSLVIVEACNADYRDKAEMLGVSPGKLKLAEQLSALDSSVDFKSLVGMSVKDLMHDIHEAEIRDHRMHTNNATLNISDISVDLSVKSDDFNNANEVIVQGNLDADFENEREMALWQSKFANAKGTDSDDDSDETELGTSGDSNSSSQHTGGTPRTAGSGGGASNMQETYLDPHENEVDENEATQDGDDIAQEQSGDINDVKQDQTQTEPDDDADKHNKSNTSNNDYDYEPEYSDPGSEPNEPQPPTPPAPTPQPPAPQPPTPPAPTPQPPAPQPPTPPAPPSPNPTPDPDPEPTNPPDDSGGGSGSGKNPNAGPGNNSGNNNPNSGPGNNSGNGNNP